MKMLHFALPIMLLFPGCSPSVADSKTKWRAQQLGSGRTAEIFAFQLAYGDNSVDDRMRVDYHVQNAKPDIIEMEKDAQEVFALIRPTCETLGLRHAELSVFPTRSRRGEFESFHFQKANENQWNCQRQKGKVYTW